MSTHTTQEFNAISLKLASPERIREWSRGEVTKPETINYRTGRSERGGLFDERIFGPEKDYECYCGKYKRIRYAGIICEKCGVEVTKSVVRRERMGHIDLASPVAHIWFLRGIPSRMSLLLGVPVMQLEKVVYFAGYIITNVYEVERERVFKELDNEFKSKMKALINEDDKEKLREVMTLTKKEIGALAEGVVLTEAEYHKMSIRYGSLFDAGIGAEAVYEMFKKLDLVALEKELTITLEKIKTAEKIKIEKRLSLVRSLIKSNARPEWMFLTAIPIIPPALRPMVALDGGRHATSDLNDLYRRVINRNNRLAKLKEIGAPDVILRNEKRILQEAVDALIDNSIRRAGGSQAMSQSQRRTLKSLSDNLKGKQGLFRQNLLGKRVDYSGRSVIVVGPQLKLNQCGLPKHMALELFRPFIIGKILDQELAFNIRGAGKLIEEGAPEVWSILEEVIQDKYVLLNRAPTLHRLSIQAFNPVLIEGNAIQVHPLVCTAFNADFDGDQMAVHVPLSIEAQQEAKALIASNKNLVKPQDGIPITTPSQDIVLGCYWMTKMMPGVKGEGKIFESPNAAILAYDFMSLDLRAKIMVRGSASEKYAEFNGELFETTVGRLLFNSVFPDDFKYINQEIKKKDLSKIVDSIIQRYGIDGTPALLDKIKQFGFKYVTRAGVTWGFDDAKVPEGKKAIIDRARSAEATIRSQYDDGLLSEDERYRKIIEIWEAAKKEIEGLVGDHLSERESAYDMVTSGARGSINSMAQMSGMKGLIINTSGRIIEFPVVPSFKEGLSPIEYFTTTHGSRKGLTDTALNTAKAGYLTRRLVDVAQEIVVTEQDCGTKDSVTVSRLVISGVEIPFGKNLWGRILAEPILDTNGKMLFERGHLLSASDIHVIESNDIQSAMVRSPLKCKTLYGICATCYGLDMGRQAPVKVGEAVGVVAAQAIGEPGTQLTLRTFHAGGVSGLDITTGLPRVEEVLERRNPKAPAVVATVDGIVSDIIKKDKEMIISVLEEAGGAKEGKKTHEYTVDYRRVPLVDVGDTVSRGDLLTDGSANILDIFKYGGESKAQEYVIREILRVYELHSASISRKHVEIIVRQMFSRVRVLTPGDTSLTSGEIIERIQFEEENAPIAKSGGLLATAETVVLGITEVSLSTKSWLASSSFQHTTRTLVTNAVKGGTDILRGLKENVILGNLIPAGTGLVDDFIPGFEVSKHVEDSPAGE
jgi:DNA-directed RNA polymerase subunit beta'